MLVFLPGLICDATLFAPQLAAFAGSRVIESYSAQDDLMAMARTVLAETSGPLEVFGHSMGGRIALEMHRLEPKRIRRLALVSTGVHPVGAAEPAKRAALQAIGDEQGFEALVDNWLTPMIAERNRAPAVVAPLRAMCLAQGRERFDAHVRAMLGRRDARPLLRDIACPTLVMTGEEDSWSPPAQLASIAQDVAGSTLVLVEGAGHMITVERPVQVNAAINRWLTTPAA